jgi:hypothetical protein
MPVGITDGGLVEKRRVVEKNIDRIFIGHRLDLAVHGEGDDAARGSAGVGRHVGEIEGGIGAGKIARIDQAEIRRRIGSERL